MFLCKFSIHMSYNSLLYYGASQMVQWEGDEGSVSDQKRPWRWTWWPLQHSCLGNPWTEEPGGLRSTGCLRVRCDFATKATPVLESSKYRFERAFSVKKVIIKLSYMSFKKFNAIFLTLFMFAMQNFKNSIQ